MPQSQEWTGPTIRVSAPVKALTPWAMGTEASFEHGLLEHPRKTRLGRLYKQEHNYCYKKGENASTMLRLLHQLQEAYGVTRVLTTVSEVVLQTSACRSRPQGVRPRERAAIVDLSAALISDS